jgi:hypothetical protein
MTTISKKCAVCSIELPKGGRKACSKVCSLEYRLEHRREISRNYYHKNRERIVARRQKDKERASEYARKWRQENRERLRETQRRYHEENKEYISERSRKWHQANKELVTERNRTRRAKIRGILAVFKELNII